MAKLQLTTTTVQVRETRDEVRQAIAYLSADTNEEWAVFHTKVDDEEVDVLIASIEAIYV